MGRLLALSLTAGIATTHLLEALIPSLVLLVASVLFACCHCLSLTSARLRVGRIPFAVFTAFALGMSYTSYRAQIRLNDCLDESLENYVTRLNVQIASLTQDAGVSLQFDARVVDDAPVGVPSTIRVNWPRTIQAMSETGGALIDLRPGQIWRVALLLKRPHTLMNPHGFDAQALMFQRAVGAVGRVRGQPVLSAKPAGFEALIFVEQIRQKIRTGMRALLMNARYGAVMVALAIGDQNSVSSDDWRIFNLTGITHLVSISGSHVTMMAALGASLVMWSVKRLKVRHHPVCEFVAASKIAMLCAVLLAFLYCLLAGWGVPAQRTFFMLCTMAAFQLTSFPAGQSRVLCTAALVVSLIDPWSTITTGFWLSFGAVAVLFYLGSDARPERMESGLDKNQDASTSGASPNQHQHHRPGWRRGVSLFIEACKLQWLISVALCPILIFLFQQFSASSLLANALAIPVVSFVVTPFALASALLVLIPGGQPIASALLLVAHTSFDWLMVFVRAVAQIDWLLFDFPAVPIWVVTLAICALALGLAPKGTPSRAIAWFWFLPLVLYKPERPAAGDWRLIVADVGQASAILLQTKTKNMLFDTGLKMGDYDSAQRVLLPLFRSQGIRALDHVIVSHQDNDHAGGLLSLLKAIPVRQISSSFDVAQYVDRHDKQKDLRLDLQKLNRCEAGQRWSTDGIRFAFLTNASGEVARLRGKPLRSNASSCVLLIQGARHSVLLTGDIGVEQEQWLLKEQSIQADVVLVPHHGSQTSSSMPFVTQMLASHAIVQAGMHNRFGHPNPEVERRWRRSGATFWRTDRDGAIVATSTSKRLSVTGQRHTHRRYWHHP